MSLLRAQSVSHHFSGTYVLSDVQWQVAPGSRWGLVGRNGAGKTTLLRILSGELQPSSGTVWKRPGLRVAMHRQLEEDVDPALPARAAVAAGLESLAELEAERAELHRLLAALTPESEDAHDVLGRLGHVEERYAQEGGYSLDYRIEQALAEIGLPEASWDLPVGALSGGQRTRLRLARLWLSDPELLLLDEPTNHLDLETTEWLEERLQSFSGTLILISHDRAFLDALVDHVAEVERGGLTVYLGDYTAYRETKAVEFERAVRAYQLEKRERDRIEDFIRRNIVGQKTKQARSRRKQLARRSALVRPMGEKSAADLRFFEASMTGDQVLVAHRLTRRFGENVVIRGVDLRVTRGERIGIVGPNGSGKSTLIRTLAGVDPPDAGELAWGSRIQRAYYDQRQDILFAHRSVLDEIWSVQPLETQETMRTYLGRFDFRADEVFRPTSTLSGGEKSRLALAKLILAGANVLLLDEPTNHLDLASQESLAEALTLFSGTLLLASHDRYLLDQLVDKLWVVGEGKVQTFDGAYSEWRERRDARAGGGAGGVATGTGALRQGTPRAAAPSARAAGKAPVAKAAGKSAEASSRGSRSSGARKDPRRTARDLEKLEARIAEVERKREDLTLEMADPENAMNWVRLGQLKALVDALEAELRQHYAAWEDKARELEQA